MRSPQKVTKSAWKKLTGHNPGIGQIDF